MWVLLRFRRFVIKADLSDTKFDDILSGYDMADLEINCYSVVLPRVIALMHSIGDTSKLAAKCFKVNRTSCPRYMIFDDLTSSAFRNADRRIGLDMAHMEMVVVKLAKWHATTGHLGEIDPEIFSRRTIRPITLEPKPFDAFFVNSMKSSAAEVKKWSGCEVYGEKLLKLSQTILEKSFHAYDRDADGFNCLTHSDLWMNNIMFKYDGQGKPEDVVFVDYAIGYYGSPALDLMYFLFSSNIANHGEEQWDRLIRMYHEELVVVLTKLGYKKKIPSLLDIYIECIKRAHFALLTCTFLFPLRLVEDGTHADMSGLIGDEPEKVAFRKQLFSHPKYRSFLEPVLKFCYRKGILG